MNTDTKARLDALQPELVAIRRDIHAHPEMGMEEVRTSALVASTLRGWGLDVTEGVGKYGVVATLKGRQPGQRAIGLRRTWMRCRSPRRRACRMPRRMSA